MIKNTMNLIEAHARLIEALTAATWEASHAGMTAAVVLAALAPIQQRKSSTD
jgi:hypothetical protein